MNMDERLLGKKRYAFYRDPLAVILIILIVLLLFRIFFLSRYMGIYVVGSSMSPTLTGASSISSPGGDYLYADTHAEPEHGDIVVVEVAENDAIIKRVIALGGDSVYLDRGVVYIMYAGTDSFVALEESYVDVANNSPDYALNTTEVTVVPEGYMYLLGDNRTNSHDSRYPDYGCFPESDLVGVIAEWSLNCKSFLSGLYSFFAFGAIG